MQLYSRSLNSNQAVVPAVDQLIVASVMEAPPWISKNFLSIKDEADVIRASSLVEPGCPGNTEFFEP
jgi:hypothetical protein